MIADNEGGQAWFGAARHSAGDRTAINRLALHISDLPPSEGVLMTTYHSNGQEVATGAPFTEIRTTAETTPARSATCRFHTPDRRSRRAGPRPSASTHVNVCA